MKLTEKFNKDETWFISDTHFGHSNIIKYCDRPFESVKEMNQRIVDEWNKVVKKNDVVFHLGDFSLTNTKTTQHIIDSLNGKIHLIVGNHEKSVLNPAHIRKKFETISDLLEIVVEDDELGIGYAPIVMCHYPLMSWNKSYHGAWHLFGHVHGTIEHPSPNAYEVGVDVNNFAPVSYEKLKEIITKKNLKR